MPKPVLFSEEAIAANLSNKTKQCHIIVPGDYLSIDITKDNVVVKRTDDLVIDVLSARARRVAEAWVLVVKTRKVPKCTTTHGDTEEIEVTVTNPDTEETSDPTDPPIDVVYYDEEGITDEIRPVKASPPKLDKEPAGKQDKKKKPKKGKD